MLEGAASIPPMNLKINHLRPVHLRFGLSCALAAALATACSKPAPAPPATPAPSATPTATPAPAAKYSGAQQMQYTAQAKDAFLAQRQQGSQPFLDAHNAFEAAGGVTPAGLTSKEAVTARRDLIAKCLAGNDIYIAFITNQEATYRADLAATPLIPEDVDSLVKDFAAHTKTQAIIQVRQKEAEILKCGDEMMATLEKTYGQWSVSPAGRLSFKKKSETAEYTALSEKYNKLVAESDELLKLVNPAPSASPGASESPGAASPAASPGA
jgi:hypothetical protein